MHGEDKQRININIPVETLAKVDDYAKKMSINRTSAILVLISTALDTQKAMSDLSELLELYKDMSKDK